MISMDVGDKYYIRLSKAFECIAIVMAVYLTLSLLISAVMDVYNARVALRGWSA